MNAILEAVGLEPDWQDKRVYHSRRRRVEVCVKFAGPALRWVALDDDYHTLQLGLVFLTIYIRTPRVFKSWECFEGGVGFSFTEDSIHINWGNKTKVYWYPWSWDFVRRWEWVDGYCADGSDGQWFEIPRRARHNAVASKHIHDFTYTLKSGEVQHRKATVSRDRMEWRWRWLMWLPWPRKIRTCIWVDFDGEVGERTGSWKGGATGCGYDMEPEETPLQTLRRMERERKFT